MQEIAEAKGLKADQVELVMRAVHWRGYFREVGEFGSNVYANNRLSGPLLTSHPRSVLANVQFWGDESFRAITHLDESIKASSRCPTGLSTAFGGRTMWELLTITSIPVFKSLFLDVGRLCELDG